MLQQLGCQVKSYFNISVHCSLTKYREREKFFMSRNYGATVIKPHKASPHVVMGKGPLPLDLIYLFIHSMVVK